MRAPILAFVLLLASCGIVRPLPHVAYRTCPADQDQWQIMVSPPSNAAELIAAAKPDVKPLGYGRKPTLFWFRNQSGSLLLCRTVVAPGSLGSCGAQAWQFQNIEGRWQLDDIASVLVCG
jgi:hypothetical protein